MVMNPKLLLYPLLVPAGGCCYGILSTIVKLAYERGYTFADVVVSQYFWLGTFLAFCVGGFCIFLQGLCIRIFRRCWSGTD